MSEQKFIFCTSCGERLMSSKAFCTACGSALQIDTHTSSEQDRTLDVGAAEIEQESVPVPIDDSVPPIAAPQEDERISPAQVCVSQDATFAQTEESVIQDIKTNTLEKDSRTNFKIALAAVLGAFAAIIVAAILGFAMPESSLGRAVTGIFSQEEQATVAEEDTIYESVEEVRYEDTDTVEEATVGEVVYYEPTTEPPPTLGEFTGRYDEVPDSEFLQQSLAEIRAIGDTGDAGAIGRLAADFNANNAQRSTVLEREADRILRELDNIEAWILEYAAPSQARDNQIDLIALCRERVAAIQRAMHAERAPSRQRDYLDAGADARRAYEHILAEGDLY